jgi:hypothetical protein
MQKACAYSVVTCGLSGCTILSALSHKRQDWQEKIIEHKMCISIFLQGMSENFFVLRGM